MVRSYAVPNKLAIAALKYLDDMGGKVPCDNKFGKQLWFDLFCRGYIIKSGVFLGNVELVSCWERCSSTLHVLRRWHVSSAERWIASN